MGGRGVHEANGYDQGYKAKGGAKSQKKGKPHLFSWQPTKDEATAIRAMLDEDGVPWEQLSVAAQTRVKLAIGYQEENDVFFVIARDLKGAYPHSWGVSVWQQDFTLALAGLVYYLTVVEPEFPLKFQPPLIPSSQW